MDLHAPLIEASALRIGQRTARWAGEDGACIRPAPYLQGEFV